MLLTIKALRTLRIRLEISQKTVAYKLHLAPTTISCYEIGFLKIPPQRHHEYEKFLFDLLNEKISAQRKKKKFYPSLNPRDCVSRECAMKSKAIRLAANVSLNRASKVINKRAHCLRQKEIGKVRMLKTEHDALIAFYKSEKLKNIFGRNS